MYRFEEDVFFPRRTAKYTKMVTKKKAMWTGLAIGKWPQRLYYRKNKSEIKSILGLVL